VHWLNSAGMGWNSIPQPVSDSTIPDITVEISSTCETGINHVNEVYSMLLGKFSVIVIKCTVLTVTGIYILKLLDLSE